MLNTLGQSLLKAGLQVLVAALKEAVQLQADPKNRQEADDAIVGAAELAAKAVTPELPAYVQPFVPMLINDATIRPLADQLNEEAANLLKQALTKAEQVAGDTPVQ